ncbi:MAG: zinc ribbon domain-containing protein [Actinomycetota bacterium]|jgi:RNA polymerase subunit RPABC4/transcription elongation factor Spt4|nr:zinc ribbon domain-containing protein [Actinomycetota bacterium]
MVVAATKDEDFFQNLSDFFGSETWAIIRDALLLVAAVFWLAVAYWVFKDARRRIESPWLVAAATLLGLALPFVGVLIYVLFRPPEYLDEVRERELEIKAMEETLAVHDLRCPVCRAQVEATFLVCPVCTTRLKQACESCKQPLEPLWQICPYCETPIETPGTLELGPVAERARRRRSK